MVTSRFTNLFIAALLATTIAKLWLSSRQMRFVVAHRGAVPTRFAETVTLAAHRKAADYTIARARIGMFETLVNAALLVGFTLLGGLQMIDDVLAQWIGASHPIWHQLAFVGMVSVIYTLVDLPFALYRQFVLEAHFGFNRMSIGLFVADMAKNTMLAIALGAPLVALVLWLMQAAGSLWWLYAWFVWIAFNLLLLWLFPTFIAPLFNKFQPLADTSLKTRIEGLLKRCGFASKGVFVMDGSKRSAHGNAYFTGLGAAKRIVFFDTLISKLTPDEIEAVLAHELGHFAKKHVVKRIAWGFAMSLAGLALLGWLAQQPWFYLGLGTDPTIATRNVFALMLFFLVLPVFLFPLSPVSSFTSRRHEFEADAYAALHADPDDLIRALVKLYEDNASTLTPDPLHSTFYDSHPPAALRIGRLESFARADRGAANAAQRAARASAS
ncbi:MAG: M48 family metallopeptidase [Burkholderiaceae bacterium]